MSECQRKTNRSPDMSQVDAEDRSGRWWLDRANLIGKTAIITGGAGGLGEAITLDLASNGVNIALIDCDEAATKRMSKELISRGVEAIVHTGDVRKSDDLDALFEAVADKWKRLDILVNVVGGTFKGAFTEQSERAWDALIRTNLTHVLQATSRAVPAMRAGGRAGSIINITTIEGYRAAPNFAVYSAAKAAVAQFARSLAIELAPEGIRVNNVAPDLAPTPNMLGIGSTESSHPMLNPINIHTSVPMGRLGTPSDISNAVIFLASGLSSYMTGMTLHPDGGTFASAGWLNWPDEGFSNILPSSVLQHYTSPPPS